MKSKVCQECGHWDGEHHQNCPERPEEPEGLVEEVTDRDWEDVSAKEEYLFEDPEPAMTDLFGNPINEPGIKPATKPSATPVSAALQPLPAPVRVDTPIRGISAVIREGQVTTIWNAALNPTTARQTQP